MQYYVLKQFLPGTQIWVWKLNEEDTGYAYDTPEQAEDRCITLKEQDPSRDYKVSTSI
jgi:hypothetical protein